MCFPTTLLHHMSPQDAITKYKMAAGIVNSAVAQIVGMLQHGTDIAMLCTFGDQLVHEKVGVPQTHMGAKILSDCQGRQPLY